LHTLTGIPDTLEWVLRKKYASKSSAIDINTVNVLLAQPGGSSWFWNRRFYSLYVVVGDHVVIMGDLVESRLEALEGLRNKLERCGCEF
jgi:hypothetical protein